MPERIVVIGVGADGAPLSPVAQAALHEATLVAGAPRHLDAHAVSGTPAVPIGADIEAVLEALARETATVAVLASGDPGFFGIVRCLAARFGPENLVVHPAVSSVVVAFARLGLPWDDAIVVSAHGRPLEDAVVAVVDAPKAAVLVSPDQPPEALGKALLAAGLEPGERRVAVCSLLGTEGESVTITDLAGLAAGTWDSRSVVVLVAEAPAGPSGVAARPSLAWGLADDAFDHRAGMITKAEVRAVALGKLELPPHGVMWDVGAGSASVAVEAALLAPRLRVWAVERDPESAGHARRNIAAHGVSVELVVGEAPGALGSLPPPDRVFVGGGGMAVLDAVLERLRPGGQVVATYAALDRAAQAAARLGNLTQLSVARGQRLPDGSMRLVAQNPVFVVWGPNG